MDEELDGRMAEFYIGAAELRAIEMLPLERIVYYQTLLDGLGKSGLPVLQEHKVEAYLEKRREETLLLL